MPATAGSASIKEDVERCPAQGFACELAPWNCLVISPTIRGVPDKACSMQSVKAASLSAQRSHIARDMRLQQLKLDVC